MDGNNMGLIYGLEYQCRALTSVEADSDNVRFLVGTQGPKAENQIHTLQLHEDETRTLSKAIFSHPAGEIWQLAANKVNEHCICARYGSVDATGVLTVGANIYNLDVTENAVDVEGLPGGNQLGLELSLDVGGAEIGHVSWMPGEEFKLMSLADNKLGLHDIKEGNGSVVTSGTLEGKGHNTLSFGAWNPHQNSQQYATVNEHHIRGWDVRSMSQAWTLESPGHQMVRCIDFNPNKQYYLASSGDDGAVRFWDIRSPDKPLAVRSDHSHWVWSVKYNQFHDQLLLTSSSDCHVVLTTMASISSEPLGHLVDDEDDDIEEEEEDDDNNDEKAKEDKNNMAVLDDGIIRIYDDHEDSVYHAEWSSADPWTFASLSYDGRLVINNVPRGVKFKILNLV